MAMRTVSGNLKTITASPLALFALLGAAAFAIYALAAERSDPILLTADIREALVADFELLNGRAPTGSEVDALVGAYIDQQVLLREAVDKELYLQGSQIRTRLVDQMRFVLTDPAPEPTEAELIAFYSENADFYTADRQFSFEHVFFEEPPASRLEILARLQDGGAVEGEDYWLGDRLEGYGQRILETSFGPDFIAALRRAPVGEWVGPVSSIRGTHFVRVTEVVEAGRIPYEQIRDRVAGDWLEEYERTSIETKLSALKEKYDVEIVD